MRRLAWVAFLARVNEEGPYPPVAGSLTLEGEKRAGQVGPERWVLCRGQGLGRGVPSEGFLVEGIA